MSTFESIFQNNQLLLSLKSLNIKISRHRLAGSVKEEDLTYYTSLTYSLQLALLLFKWKQVLFDQSIITSTAEIILASFTYTLLAHHAIFLLQHSFTS